MTDIALQVDGLSKFFRVAHSSGGHDPRRERLSWRNDRFWALRQVSFSVERGQTLGIIGHNGSGKSTLLKILSGVMSPDGGRFEAHGRIGALLELGAGFHPELTGIENVYLNGALLGMGTREVDRLLPQIIAFAELERFMDMPVKHFSSGMTARLGFAVASQLAPEILLLDETFATGDARFQVKAFEHMAMMHQRGHTMIVVSHNLEMMMRLVDRVLWLDHGVVRRDGPMREVLAEYRHSRADLEAAAIMHSVLGIESVFEDSDPARAVVRLAAVRWRVAEEDGAGERRPESPDGEIIIRTGQHLVAELVLEHPDPHPAAVGIETAWARADGRILAQSRTLVPLEAGGLTHCTVQVGPWKLIEGVWRGRLALAPASETDRPRQFCYYDQSPAEVVVRCVTPNPIEVIVVATIDNTWTVGLEERLRPES